MFLGDSLDVPSENCVPCPRCGSTLRSPRSLSVSVTETVRITEYRAMLHEQAGQAIGFSESPRDGRSTAATLDPEAGLKFSVYGKLVGQLHGCQLLERFVHDEVADHSSSRILESLDTAVDLQNEVLGAVYRAADDCRDDDRFVVFRHQTLGPTTIVCTAVFAVRARSMPRG